jgi:ribonuclease J
MSTDNTRILFDIGKELPTLNSNTTGANDTTFDWSRLFSQKRPVDAVIISHYHGDHIGHLDVVPQTVPIVMGEKAAGIYNIMGKFTDAHTHVKSAQYLVHQQEIKIGEFTIIPFLVDHSAFDAYAFLIEAEGKKVIYTGDLRTHGNKAGLMNAFLVNLPSLVDAILIEGTMMSRLTEKVLTEKQIGEEAQVFMNQPDRPIFVVQSSTNIDRLVQMYKAAKRSKRLFVMDIYTANVVSVLGGRIPNPQSFKDVRVFYPYHLTKKMFELPGNHEEMFRFSRYRISSNELANRKDYCMLIRDSMLFDLENRLGNIEGAGVIYSMWKGYLQSEKIKKLIDFCKQKNIEIVCLHTSGHADVESLKRIVQACSPQKIIPVHTEYPERFMEIFGNVVIADDGQTISI